MPHRVVVTGMGTLTSIGTGRNTFWQAVKSGTCGIRPISAFDASAYKASLASEVSDFNPETYMEKREARRMDRFAQMAMAASALCIQDANIDLSSPKIDLTRFGVNIGSGIGGLGTIEREQQKLLNGGPNKVSPLMVPMIISNLAAGNVAIRYGLKGMCSCPVTACATGSSAIGDAFRYIRHGYADRMLAGGAEASITPLSLAGFINITALNTTDDPQRASIPFDAERAGFIMGEGAGVLLLESYEAAEARGAEIYAEIIGYGATCDAYHITGPDPEGEGAARAMCEALAEAQLQPSDIDYINAHGTATPPNDKTETLAIKKALGDYAYRVPVSSTKSMIGHLLGAAGAVEAIICVEAILDSFVPATINYRTPDPECDLDIVPNVGRHQPVRTAMTNSLGFGGHNTTLILRQWEA